MRRRSHVRLFLIATCIWAGFLFGGLPSYYQQYSTATMVIFDLVVLVPITGIVYFVLRGVRDGKRLPLSYWVCSRTECCPCQSRCPGAWERS